MLVNGTAECMCACVCDGVLKLQDMKMADKIAAMENVRLESRVDLLNIRNVLSTAHSTMCFFSFVKQHA